MPQSNEIDDDAADEPIVMGKVGLLQRENELAEFTDVLTELGIPVISFSNELPHIEDLQDVRLILASTERLLESGPPHLSNWPRTVAVIQDPSKTLSAHLGRIGVSMILCRPLHPQAIRLLLLHEVYRGPEKRVRGRTLIGQPVRLRSRLLSSKGTMLDLSPSGARVQVSGSPKVGSKMRLCLGAEINQGKPLKLATQVVRCGRKEGSPFSEVGLAILDAKQNRKAIATILRHFAFGPGRWTDCTRASTPEPTAHPATDASAPSSKNVPISEGENTNPDRCEEPPIRQLPPSTKTRAAVQDQGISVQAACSASSPQHEDEAPEPCDTIDENFCGEISHEDNGESEDDSERRRNLRVPYDRRIVALGEEAARVLVGQDLSAGGMRVLSRDGVMVGDLLKVALHCGTMMEPVVVSARAVREHGEDGMILNFEDLTATQVEHLEKIVSSSGPIQYMADDSDPEAVDDAQGPIVIGELLNRAPADQQEDSETE